MLPKDLLLLSSAQLDITAAEGQPTKINIVAYNGGVMTVPGFGPVVVDLAGMELSASIPLLADHENTLNSVVGSGVPTKKDGALLVAGTVSTSTDAGRQAVELSASGVKLQSSIGIVIHTRRQVRAGESVYANGQRLTASGVGFLYVSKSTLREVSVCALGCDTGTSVSIAAKEELTMNEFDTWLVANGFDVATLSDDQKLTLMAAHEAEFPPAKPPVKAKEEPAVDPAIELRAKASTELYRQGKIATACGTNLVLAAKAIGENWSFEKTELEVLRASRSNGPAIHVSEPDKFAPNVLEAAACQTLGYAQAEKDFTPEVMQAAHTAHKGRLRLSDLLMRAAWQNGYQGHSFHSEPEAVLRAAFSTTAISGILSNIANKFLLQAYNAVESTWRSISAVRPVKDFKTVTSYRMTGAANFEQVSATGEIKHGTLGQQSFTNAANTYGKMFALTRQDLINDDLGALSAVPMVIGRGAALKFNLVFWAAFMDNSSFFSATHTTSGDTGNSNYQSGGSTALSIASLTAAELLFLNQVDPNGEPLGIIPQLLLVPNALNVPGSQFTRDLEVRDTTASTKYTTSNPHAGKWNLVRSSYLSNTTMTGYSTTAWYLLANPQDVPVIESCFLNGQETPIVETAEAEFSTLGIQMRGYFDFGVSKQDYRGGVKSAGA